MGAVKIDNSYPRSYSETEMRQWAQDLKSTYRSHPDDIERWSTLDTSALSAEQRRLVKAHRALFTDPERGIKGSLRDDGLVELDGGRHRAAYMVEQGVEAVPVWVTAPDAESLTCFADSCAREIVPSDRDLTERWDSREREVLSQAEGSAFRSRPLPLRQSRDDPESPDRPERSR